MRGATLTILAVMALAGCEEPPTLLVVDVRTDLVPGVEFDAIRTEVISGSGAGRSVDHAVDIDADYVAGVRVAELGGLERGELTLRVTLLRDGVEVVARPVRVTLEGTLAVTVVVTRDCRGVECPAADGDPVAEACVGGMCTDPSCTEEQPEACQGACVEDADCPAPAAACASARCIGGACGAVSDDACGADEYCEAETGCRPVAPEALCPPFSGTGLDVIAFAESTCVLSAEGRLRCWGYNAFHLGEPFSEPIGTPREVQPDTAWSQVGLGTGHFCGMDQTGGPLQCVGEDWAGQLGDGDGASPSSSLRTPVGMPIAAQVSAGEAYTCAIDTGGALSCWGGNGEGQIGADRTDEFVWEPATVVSAATWAQVEIAGPHACGITTGGALYCWGSNSNYELAEDPATLDQSAVPYAMGADTDWVEVAVGREFVLARKTDGTLYSWGGDFDGQLGREGIGGAILQVGADSDWVQIEAGFRHACGLRAGGALWCWGSNQSGQLTDAVTEAEIDLPRQVAIDRTWVDVAVGHRHTCALDDTGRVWCWGSNEEQQLGLGPGLDRGEPRTVCP